MQLLIVINYQLMQIANLHQLYLLQRICNPLVVFFQRIANPSERNRRIFTFPYFSGP